MNNFLLDFLSLAAILSGIFVITSKNPVISVLFLISVFVNVAGYLVLIGVGFLGISYIIVYVGAIAILFLFVVIMLNLQLSEINSVGTEYGAPLKNLPLGAILGSLFVFEIISIIRSSALLSNQTLYANWLSDDTIVTGNSIDSGIVSVVYMPYQVTLGIINYINTLFIPSHEAAEITSNISYSAANVYHTFDPTIADTHFVAFHQIQSIGSLLYTSGAMWLLLASIILLLAIAGPIALSLNKN